MILKNQENMVVYSDGETTEKRMLEIAQKYPEDLSQDYIARCSEYTVNNTFSSVRRNILNWYSFKENATILEIGAGMGAVTGLLCDKAERVVSIEMSGARAEVIRARYGKRDNLEIISADITQWDSKEKFDYVIFIGVLEYAGVFSDAENPYEKFLSSAKKHLKEDGILLFAIENKLGLKYWIGASEDHLQKPFAGLKGYTEKKTPKTFSKYELSQMLENTGFKYRKFYYVLPDYKFPEIIATDERQPDYLTLKKVSFTYSKNSLLTLDEKRLYKDVLENQVLDFFANSFLIEAGKDEPAGNHVIYVSGRGEAKKEYRVSTIIYDDGSILKIPMHESAVAHIQKIYDYTQYLADRGIHILPYEKRGETLFCKIYKGKSAQEYFAELLKKNARGQLFEFLENFRKELLKTSEQVFDKSILNEMDINVKEYQIGPVLEKGFIDMTFYNCFYDNDEFIFYDQEWCFENIPLDFILFYSIKSTYTRLQVETEISLEEIWRYLKITQNIEIYSRIEDYIWSKVLYRQTDFYGDGGYCNRFDEKRTVEAELEQRQNTISNQDAIIEHAQEVNEKNELEIVRQRQLIEAMEEKQKKQKEICERQITAMSDERRLLEEKVAELTQEVLNKEGHIELLLPPEREYKKIVNSKMFKCMRFICGTYDVVMIIPRFVGRNIAAFIRMMTHVNPQELKIAWGYVKNEGIVGAYRHLMRDYHQGELKKIQVDVEKKIFDEITDINLCEKIVLPQFEKPQVSIVIPVYNQFTYTYYCIKSILENSGDISYEVILADDCSDDLTTQITTVVENIIVAKTETNLRFLRNCNNAAKYAKGQYILFLNNDTQVQRDWLKPLVELIERDATIGMVGSKLVYADGSLQEAGGIIWSDGSGWNYGRNDDAMKPEYNYVRDVDYVSGAAIMIRKNLWEQLGGFDEHFAPAYCEDSDLAFMVRRAGYRTVYQPASVVVHFEGKSNGTNLNSGVKKYQVENSIKLRKKWKKELSGQYENAQCVFKARERSKNKKVILVIDHYVPQFDKDAGSRTTFQYLKMFVKQGYSVKFIGDNFYQDEPYTTVLQQMGVEVLYGSWYAQHWQEWILDNKKYIDFVYLNRPHITIKYIDFLKEKTDIKCIYYGHDLHFLRLRREYELTGVEEKLKESNEWLEKELYIMRRADITYYPSYIEEEEIHKIDPDIRVKAITAYVFESFLEKISRDFMKREGIMFVGGFGHPPNEDAVLWFAKEVYPLIEQRLKMPFYIVGSKPTEAVKRLNSENIIVKGFVSEEELAHLYNTCKIVVVPLRYGAGVKGKVVEALYYGAPMVTTSVGTEGIKGAEDIIEIEETPEKFADAVVSLYTDNARLARTVDAYQRFVKDHFSVEAVWDIIRDDFS